MRDFVPVRRVSGKSEVPSVTSPTISLAAEFGLALGFECVSRFARWTLGHPSRGVVGILPGSIVGIPYVGQLDDCRGRADGVERPHRIADDPALQFGLIGRAGLMTEGKIDEHRARRFY